MQPAGVVTIFEAADARRWRQRWRCRVGHGMGGNWHGTRRREGPPRHGAGESFHESGVTIATVQIVNVDQWRRGSWQVHHRRTGIDRRLRSSGRKRRLEWRNENPQADHKKLIVKITRMLSAQCVIEGAVTRRMASASSELGEEPASRSRTADSNKASKERIKRSHFAIKRRDTLDEKVSLKCLYE